MKVIARSMLVAGVIGVGVLALGTTEARAQGFGFNYASPGMSFGFGTGGYGGYYGGYGGYPYGGAYGPYPYVAGPVLVPGPMVVPRRVIVPGPVVVPRGYYHGGGRFRGYPYYRR